eukprot:SAG22_NODE_22226_length_241_cov_51.704225_1_plen_55_part_01
MRRRAYWGSIRVWRERAGAGACSPILASSRSRVRAASAMFDLCVLLVLFVWFVPR